MHTVAVLAMNGLVALDTAIPCDLFSQVRLPNPAQEYSVRVCGETPEVRAGAYNIRSPWVLADLLHADTVIVPGIHNPELPIPRQLLAQFKQRLRMGRASLRYALAPSYLRQRGYFAA
jgi:hypothetical protein